MMFPFDVELLAQAIEAIVAPPADGASRPVLPSGIFLNGSYNPTYWTAGRFEKEGEEPYRYRYFTSQPYPGVQGRNLSALVLLDKLPTALQAQCQVVLQAETAEGA